MLVMNSTVLREVLLIWMPYFCHQVIVLERVAVDAGGADVQREPRRIDDELVGVPALLHPRPALLRVEIGLDAGRSVFAAESGRRSRRKRKYFFSSEWVAIRSRSAIA